MGDNMKSFACIAAFIATASAAPQLLAHGVVAHPAGYAQPDLAEPSPYSYTYAVADDYSGAAFNQAESNDGTGVVSGSYSVNLPDGRVQNVNYHANDYDGYVADVTYDGVAAYANTVAHPVAHAVAHPVVHAVAHPAVVAHPVAHAVAHPAVLGHSLGHGIGLGHGVGLGHGLALGHGVGLGHGLALGHRLVGHGVGLGHGLVGHGVGLGHGVAHLG